jgi:hypothetical protein
MSFSESRTDEVLIPLHSIVRSLMLRPKILARRRFALDFPLVSHIDLEQSALWTLYCGLIYSCLPIIICHIDIRSKISINNALVWDMTSVTLHFYWTYPISPLALASSYIATANERTEYHGMSLEFLGFSLLCDDHGSDRPVP